GVPRPVDERLPADPRAVQVIAAGVLVGDRGDSTSSHRSVLAFLGRGVISAGRVLLLGTRFLATRLLGTAPIREVGRTGRGLFTSALGKVSFRALDLRDL